MKGPRALLWVCLAAAAVAVALASPWASFILTVALAKGLAALGVALLLRAGLMSLGHALFYAAGGYGAAYLARWLGVTDLLLLLGAGFLSATVLGLFTGAVLVRYRAIFFAMLNLAASMVFFSLVTKLYNLTGGSDGMPLPVPTMFGLKPGQGVFYLTLACVFVCAGGLRRYLDSAMGQGLGAIATNEIRLEYLGISVNGLLFVNYAISAGLGGLGGALAAIAIGHVTPELFFWTTSAQLLLGAALGGAGSVAGPFAGMLLLEGVRTAASQYAPLLWEMAMGLCALAVALFVPQGLSGIVDLPQQWKRAVQ